MMIRIGIIDYPKLLKPLSKKYNTMIIKPFSIVKLNNEIRFQLLINILPTCLQPGKFKLFFLDKVLRIDLRII